MMSARGSSTLTDRVFCARTTDGGRSFSFVSWVIGPDHPHRAVMPSTVRCSSGQLVSAIRRRQVGTQRCWVDAYRSADYGLSWQQLGKVTDTGPWNGNPPALVGLADGRLCCIVGDRGTCRIVARCSTDEGKTWGGGIVLRANFRPDRYGDPDLGYPRVARRSDSNLIAIYYWATEAVPHQHIAATIWRPDENIPCVHPQPPLRCG